MTSPAGPPTHALTIGRRVRAAIDDVFDACADPRNVAASIEPRPELAVTAADRPHRLRLSWSSAAAGADTPVDITLLTSADGQTIVLLKHDGFTADVALEHHRDAWRRILDNLAASCEKKNSVPPAQNRS